jgi:hypothetical protein
MADGTLQGASLQRTRRRFAQSAPSLGALMAPGRVADCAWEAADWLMAGVFQAPAIRSQGTWAGRWGRMLQGDHERRLVALALDQTRTTAGGSCILLLFLGC